MADNKRPSFTKVMTPKGIFGFPKLNSPDTKFKPDGEYGVKVKLDVEQSEALIAKIEAVLAAYWPVAKAEAQKKVDDAVGGANKAKAKKALEEMKEADKSYRPVYNDDGEETGEYEFNFKMPAFFLKDKGKSTEKKTAMRPDVFDAKGKKLSVIPEIWGGTEGIVAGELRPFSTAVGVGVSLRLKAVQIITLRQGGSGGTADSYGFGKEEGGFEAEDEPSMADHAPEGTPDGEAGGTDEF